MRTKTPPARNGHQPKAAAVLNRSQLASNFMMERNLWLRRMLDPRRDIDFECGHPEVVTVVDYKRLFLRGDIASRVVSVWPEESWSDHPDIYETEDSSKTPFETAWDEIDKEFNVLSTLLRADILSGIGRFGIVLLGVDDGLTMSEPVENLKDDGTFSEGAQHKLLFLRAFDETLVTVGAMENNVQNPRYGMPTYYNVNFADTSITNTVAQQSQVHWSRVIHLADNRMNSNIFGLPRMEKVLNRILDLHKAAGGSAEMFWKGGFPGVALEAALNPQETVEVDTQAVKDQMEAYQNGLQRYLTLIGMQAKSLAPQIADPTPHVDLQIKLISMALSIPWRVFAGSEAAQLASEQDMHAWNKRLGRRRDEYLTPFVIRPVVQRLIDMGILATPNEFYVDWPDLDSPSDNQKAVIAQQTSDAVQKYIAGGGDALIPPFHYLTLVLGFSEEEANAMIDEASDQLLQTVPPTVAPGTPPPAAPPKPKPAINVAPPADPVIEIKVETPPSPPPVNVSVPVKPGDNKKITIVRDSKGRIAGATTETIPNKS